MIDKKFIGHEVMKKSGKPYKYGDYFSEIIDVVIHPYIGNNETCYLLQNGTYIRNNGGIIILSETKLLFKDTYFDLDILPSKDITLYRIAGKYALRKGIIDDWNFNPVIAKSNKNQNDNSNSEAFEYQKKVCGDEVLIGFDDTTYWADGILGRSLLEAKFISTPHKEPYCGNANEFTQKKVDESIIKQFRRIEFILDNHEDYDNVILITNCKEAIEHFSTILKDIKYIKMELIK